MRVGRVSRAAPREPAIEDVSFVVLDTETTGLRPDRDRVVSLAGVRVRGGVVSAVDRFDRLVHPGCPIPAASTRVHGITDGMVADAPPLDVVLAAFLSFIGEAALVGHDVWFDLAFLARETARRGQRPIESTHVALDTRALALALHGPGPSHDLDAVAARLGVSGRGRHSALGDALITAGVFVRLAALARARGIATLRQMLRFVGGRATSSPRRRRP